MSERKDDRELIDTGTDKRFVRRDADGHDQVVLARLPAASGAAGPVSEIYV